ncbi:MAG: monovalent cation/H(+) antiporter subunit G [Oscillospiraceae bacterium]|nr:monovalent cation/H(+) antiporter subunit G [Oscillospiraceae bacterium]
MIVLRIIIDILIAASAVFALAGTIGVLKMPDTFSRMQASTCVTTLGIVGVCLGGVLYALIFMHSVNTAVKILVIGGLVFCTNPVGAHAIAKGAYRHGIRPDKEMEVDDFRRDFDE